MANGRCRMHGGKSTGPRTPEGLERSRRANQKHGHYTLEARIERLRAREAAALMRQLAGRRSPLIRALLDEWGDP
jgi:hypothetical protein